MLHRWACAYRQVGERESRLTRAWKVSTNHEEMDHHRHAPITIEYAPKLAHRSLLSVGISSDLGRADVFLVNWWPTFSVFSGGEESFCLSVASDPCWKEEIKNGNIWWSYKHYKYRMMCGRHWGVQVNLITMSKQHIAAILAASRIVGRS